MTLLDKIKRCFSDCNLCCATIHYEIKEYINEEPVPQTMEEGTELLEIKKISLPGDEEFDEWNVVEELP